MVKLYVKSLGDYIELSEDGRFELPQRAYTTAELKRVAQEINRAIRESKSQEDFDGVW